MADPYPDDLWILVEQDPLAGLEPTTTFFKTRNEALVYIEPRKDAFGRFDLAQITHRRIVQKVIQAEEFKV